MAPPATRGLFRQGYFEFISPSDDICGTQRKYADEQCTASGFCIKDSNCISLRTPTSSYAEPGECRSPRGSSSCAAAYKV